MSRQIFATDMRGVTHAHAAHRAAQRFRRHSFAWGYSHIKMRTDPAYAAVAEALGDRELPVLDVGCGMGLLGLYLCERRLCHGYLGIDRDARKVRDGAAACAPHASMMRLCEGDAGALPEHHGHVAMLDVLHYMQPCRQAEALAQAMSRVCDGGALVIRTCLRDDSMRYHATRAEEWLLHASGWMRSSGARNIPSRQQIETPLRDAGFVVAVRPLWGHTPFNSYLFVARHRS